MFVENLLPRDSDGTVRLPSRWAPQIKGWAVIDPTSGNFLPPNTPGSVVSGERHNAPQWSSIASRKNHVRFHATMVMVDDDYMRAGLAFDGSETYWLTDADANYLAFLAQLRFEELRATMAAAHFAASHDTLTNMVSAQATLKWRFRRHPLRTLLELLRRG